MAGSAPFHFRNRPLHGFKFARWDGLWVLAFPHLKAPKPSPRPNLWPSRCLLLAALSAPSTHLAKPLLRSLRRTEASQLSSDGASCLSFTAFDSVPCSALKPCSSSRPLQSCMRDAPSAGHIWPWVAGLRMARGDSSALRQTRPCRSSRPNWTRQTERRDTEGMAGGGTLFAADGGPNFHKSARRAVHISRGGNYRKPIGF